jgi:tight adherence protein B
MLSAVITFVAVLLVVFGTYWLLIARHDSEEQSALRRRLKAASVKPESRQNLLSRKKQLSDVPAVDAVLKRSRGLGVRLQRDIDLSGLRMTVGRLILASSCAALGTYVLFARLTPFHSIAIVAAVSASWLPYAYVKSCAKRRLAKFEELFPEAIDLLARALRAGHAFTTGMAMVADELGDPVGPEFRLAYDRQNFGLPLPDALRGLAERVPLLDARFFVTAVLTQRDAGGNLAEVLGNLGSVIRDRFKVKRQIRVVTAHARITAWVLAGLPPAVTVALLFISPDHMKTLFTDPLGLQIVFAALALQITGTLIIKRLVNFEY